MFTENSDQYTILATVDISLHLATIFSRSAALRTLRSNTHLSMLATSSGGLGTVKNLAGDILWDQDRMVICVRCLDPSEPRDTRLAGP